MTIYLLPRTMKLSKMGLLLTLLHTERPKLSFGRSECSRVKRKSCLLLGAQTIQPVKVEANERVASSERVSIQFNSNVSLFTC